MLTNTLKYMRNTYWGICLPRISVWHEPNLRIDMEWSLAWKKSRKKKLSLKELYTSQTTLAQKIVLTSLNNEFKLKIWNTTSFMLKNPPEFLKKIHKNQFSASWRGLMVFIHKYKVVYFKFKYILVIVHHNARTTLKATFEIFLQIF